jgi:hypothetical protein
MPICYMSQMGAGIANRAESQPDCTPIQWCGQCVRHKFEMSSLFIMTSDAI